MIKTKIGLGMAAIGRPEYINLRQESDSDKSEKAYLKRALNLLNFAYSIGIRHFDTAPSYGKGEAFLQEWVDKYKPQKVDLSTKWGYTYVANWEMGFEGSHEIKEHSLIKLREQWKVSKNLLPRLKIYQIHSATFDSEVLENKEVLKELFDLKKLSDVKIGLSVSGVDQAAILKAAHKIEINNQKLFDSFQVTYNLLDSSTHEFLKSVLKEGKTVIIKEALANARLFRQAGYEHYMPLYDCLDALASKYRVGVDAIALRFIMDSLKPSVVLSGASNSKQLEENLLAEQFELNKKELQLLRTFSSSPEIYWNERKNLIWN